MSKPVISVVACLLPEFGIGYQGQLPWKLRKEMKYFKDITTSTLNPTKRNAVIMGRKTWESIPNKFKPLPNRLNVIVSTTSPSEWPTDTLSSTTYEIKCNDLYKSLNNLQKMDDIEKIYIIGGAQIYNSTYDYCSHMLITQIQKPSTIDNIPMDTFLNKKTIDEKFQKKSQSDWQTFVNHSGHSEPTHKETDFEFEFTLYEKR